VSGYSIITTATHTHITIKLWIPFISYGTANHKCPAITVPHFQQLPYSDTLLIPQLSCWLNSHFIGRDALTSITKPHNTTWCLWRNKKMLTFHPNIILWTYVYVTITNGHDHFHTWPEIKTEVIKLCHYCPELVTYLNLSHLIYHILTHNFTILRHYKPKASLWGIQMTLKMACCI
jgi:hypothetical protein